MKVIAVIPCYNEEKNVGIVVNEAKKHVEKVVVIDDGSTDRTAEVASKAGAKVVGWESRNGAGAGTGMGIDLALKDMDCGVVVTLDGDGQHDANEIPKVVKPVLEGKADLVIGMRVIGLVKGDGMPRYRKFDIDALTWLYNVGSERKIVDGQCCFRAYSRQLLETIVIEEDGFGFSTEVLVKARASGFRIKEVPVDCIYHKEFRLNSTMNPILQGLKVAWATVKWRVKVELFRDRRK